jgi:hypothetical protein
LVAVAKFIVPDWGIKSTMAMEEDGAAIQKQREQRENKFVLAPNAAVCM